MFDRIAITALAAISLGAASPPPEHGGWIDNTPETLAALAKSCKGKDGWADPAPPSHIYGNTWYVGTCGITVLLVNTKAGNILIDGGVPEAAPLVAASLAKAGFSMRDVRWIVHSHEHFDHVGDFAELKRMSGAKLAALAPAAAVLRSGKPDPADPQYGSLITKPMAPVTVDRVLRSGDTISLGGTLLTARATLVHSPGSTSWTWQSCEFRVCRTMTYADSSSTISADGYRFTDHPKRIAAVRRGLEVMSALPCGILMTPHPSASGMFERMATGQLFDPQACGAYAKSAAARFADRLATETGTAAPKPVQ